MEDNNKNPQGGTGYGDKDPIPENITIPVIHENVSIDKTLVKTGTVKIIKKINEENHELEIPLVHEEIEVKTISVGRFVDSLPDAIRYEGDTMIISVLKEVSVVRVMVEKEIHITKKKVHTKDLQTVTLRKEEVVIDDSHLANIHSQTQDL